LFSLLEFEFLTVIQVPDADREHKEWPTFLRQLVHNCLAIVFAKLKDQPECGLPFFCPDKFFRFGHLRLAAWIADYKEQVRLALIVSGRCPRCISTRAEMQLLRAFERRVGEESDELRIGGLSRNDERVLGLKGGKVTHLTLSLSVRCLQAHLLCVWAELHDWHPRR
jgi:hypothetical protein